jgi:hypothetical protein
MSTGALTYSTSTFTESSANNGSIGNTSTVTLTSATGTFGATLTAGVDVVFSNVPAGLTATISRTDATHAVIGFTGSATAHLSANDIANFTATWADSAFIGVLAADVTGTPKTDFIVDFANQASISYSGGTFTETVANGGAVSGTLTATLTGDTFVNPLGAVHGVVTNVPAGMTAVVTRTSATTADITLSGNATLHGLADSIANLTLTWADGSFTNTTLASNVTNPSYALGAVNFINQSSISYGGNFTESVANDGSVTSSRVATLVGDTFVAGVSGFTTVSNVPAGLTAVVTLH